MNEYQCVDETKAGADRRRALRCSPSVEGACTYTEDTKCVANSVRVCKRRGGKWGECVSCSPRAGHLGDSAPFSFHSPPARTPMKLLALLSLLILMLQEARAASLSKEEREGDPYAILHLGDYVLSLDNYDEVIDPSNYDELIDYGDQLPQVRPRSRLTAFPERNWEPEAWSLSTL